MKRPKTIKVWNYKLMANNDYKIIDKYRKELIKRYEEINNTSDVIFYINKLMKRNIKNTEGHALRVHIRELEYLQKNINETIISINEFNNNMLEELKKL